MHLSITSTLALMIGLTTTSSAFVVDTFSDTICGGVVETGVNTWDSTCATWPKGFKSFKITTWGGNHQFAYFFAPDDCGSLDGAIMTGYVDATTFDFKLNTCYGFSGGSANAIASYYTI